MVRIEYRTKGARRPSIGLRQLRQDLRGKFSNEVAHKGLHWASRNMPYYYGNMYRALRVKEGKMSAKLIQDQPRNARNRPYHLWMHGYGKYDIAPYIQSGDPHYMFTVQKIMRKEAQKIIKRYAKKSLK